MLQCKTDFTGNAENPILFRVKYVTNLFAIASYFVPARIHTINVQSKEEKRIPEKHVTKSF